MRKQQLIHLHALCLCLRDRIDDRVTVPADAFEAYDAMDVDPTAVHRRKAVHQDAVLALLDGLTTALVAADAVTAEEVAGTYRWVDAGGPD